MKTTPPSHEEIARRAHEIWIARGNTHGFDIGHWLEAERELLLEAAAPAPARQESPPPARPPDVAAPSSDTRPPSS